MKKLSIGNIKLKNPLFLSPMVEVTDLAYRLICRKSGAAMAYTEMLHVDAINNENQHTKNMLKTCKEDLPVGVQITGKNVSSFSQVKPKLKNFKLVDINCGCPSIRLIDSESGSFLLKSPEKIGKMISVLKDDYIVTAKIRLGFNNNNVIKIAKQIEKAGASALTIHARLASDSNKIPADWNWIAKVKREIGIPVIGNGDVTNGEKTASMLDIADGAMIARAAIGDPLVFDRILYYLKTGKEKPVDYKKNLVLFKTYLRLVKKHDIVDIGRIKYIGSNFIRGFQGAAKTRNDFMQLKTLKDIEDFINIVNI